MMQPLVSICIPTYNRSENLRGTLNSIVRQQEFIEGKAEVVISDNASSDNTEAIGTEYAERYENVFYFKNPENIRDRNFPLVLSRAHGVLRKLNNDTLELNDGALADLCNLAETYKDTRPLIFLRGDGNNSQDSAILDFETAMRRLSYDITYIGSFTIWGADCNGIADDTEGCEKLLWQVRKFLELASAQNAVLVCNKPFGHVTSVAKKDISYGLYQVFYVNYFSLLEPYFVNGQLSQETKEYLERDLLYRFFSSWIIRWELNTRNLQYSDSENLKAEVFSQYKDKDYYDDFLRYYRYRKIRYQIKQVIKGILHR